MWPPDVIMQRPPRDINVHSKRSSTGLPRGLAPERRNGLGALDADRLRGETDAFRVHLYDPLIQDE